jgi:hypothetical protein
MTHPIPTLTRTRPGPKTRPTIPSLPNTPSLHHAAGLAGVYHRHPPGPSPNRVDFQSRVRIPIRPGDRRAPPNCAPPRLFRLPRNVGQPARLRVPGPSSQTPPPHVRPSSAPAVQCSVVMSCASCVSCVSCSVGVSCRACHVLSLQMRDSYNGPVSFIRLIPVSSHSAVQYRSIHDLYRARKGESGVTQPATSFKGCVCVF